MTLRQVVTLLHEAIKPLRGSARPLTQWAPAIAQLLTTFYGRRIFQIDQPHELYTLQALEQIARRTMPLNNRSRRKSRRT